MDGDPKISRQQILASAGETASSISGEAIFYLSSLGGRKDGQSQI